MKAAIPPPTPLPEKPPVGLVPPAPSYPVPTQPSVPIRDPKYYIDEEMAIFLVDMHLFRIHRHILRRESVVFDSMFECPPPAEGREGQSDDNPIVLQGVTRAEFLALMDYFYKGSFFKSESDNKTTREEYIDLLSIATRFECIEARQKAVQGIEGHVLDPVQKIVLAQTYDVSQWLVPAYVELCQRDNPLTHDEALQIGLEKVILIGNARENRASIVIGGNSDHTCWQLRGHSPLYAPIPTTTDGKVTMTATSSLEGLPPELASVIISSAQYYARQVSHRHEKVEFRADMYFDNEINYPAIAGLYLLSSPIPVPDERSGEIFRVKSVSFRLRGADQGWATFGGDGTYHNSHTWFEASILQPVVPGSDRDTCPVNLQSDGAILTFRKASDARRSLKQFGLQFRDQLREYDIEWIKGQEVELKEVKTGMGVGLGDGKGFVETLRPGDRVALWARAEQALWKNIVDEATIVIDYEVL
ncbi:hypothetical protein V5O48_002827 [Marasmius crinis-equi]|uniref:BTB domain-containing protein n=1 Tax=Marasmius crinis-equi TaxID=585013 RepID=A0ABR3FUN5_9AGAR